MTTPLAVLTPAQHRFLGELYATRGQKELETTHNPEAAHTEAASLCAWFVRAWEDGTLEPEITRLQGADTETPAPHNKSQGEQMRLEAA